jgi:hypothetical protein
MNAENPQNQTLSSFLQDELDEIGDRLDKIKGKIEAQKGRGIGAWFRRLRTGINEDDFASLQSELNDKNKRLKDLPDDDVRLFLLRKEIENLKEDVTTLGAGRSWRIPTRAWVAICILPFVIYFVWLALFQGNSQDVINAYATQTATALTSTAQAGIAQTTIAQTATASQTIAAGPTGTPTPAPTATQ